MGLFGKPKALPCEKIEEFLQQETADTLRKLAYGTARIMFMEEGEAESFFSPRAGISVSVKPDSYYYVSYFIDYSDFKTYCKHKVPPKFKEDICLTEEILEMVLDKEHDANTAFFLGAVNEFGIFSVTLEPGTARAAYFYNLAKEYGCRLIPYMEYLHTVKFNSDIYADRTEFIINNLVFYTTEDCKDTEANELARTLCREDLKILRILYTLGVVHCQRRGNPFSTLNVSTTIKKLVKFEIVPYIDNDIWFFGKSLDYSVWLAVKVWKQAQEGDPLAAKACEMFGTAF